MIKLPVSHVDHGLTEEQLAYILARFADRTTFFLETFELPEYLGKAPCMLYGPMMGDPPVTALFEAQRGDRTWWTPVVDAPARMTRMVTVIAGPHDGNACVLYTAYAGPCAPQEPDDPGCRNVPESRRFWSEHALAFEVPSTMSYKLRERGVTSSLHVLADTAKEV